jgi:hypothetical protein
MRRGSQAGAQFKLGSLRLRSYGTRTHRAALLFSLVNFQNYCAMCRAPL